MKICNKPGTSEWKTFWYWYNASAAELFLDNIPLTLAVVGSAASEIFEHILDLAYLGGSSGPWLGNPTAAYVKIPGTFYACYIAVEVLMLGIYYVCFIEARDKGDVDGKSRLFKLGAVQKHHCK